MYTAQRKRRGNEIQGEELRGTLTFFGIIFFSIFYSEHNLLEYLKFRPNCIYYRMYLHALPLPSQMWALRIGNKRSLKEGGGFC